MNEALIPPSMLFRFAVPCRYRSPLWNERGARLTQAYRLPELTSLNGNPSWAEMRAGWCDGGIAFWMRVTGKQNPPCAHRSKPLESDGLQLWIDTRATHNIHRAGRFCHRFLFLPTGGGQRRDTAQGGMLPIHRARDMPRPAEPGQVKVRSRRHADGYTLQAFIAGEALTGFSPGDHPRLGFTYAVNDAELGTQTFSCPEPFPYDEDPSVWATLELVSE